MAGRGAGDRRKVASWWSQTGFTLAAAECLKRGGYYSWACFCAHQAAELALKAVLLQMGRDDLIEKHGLLELYRAVRRKHPHASQVRTELRALEWHYLKARYPQARYGWRPPHDLYNEQDAIVCLQYAQRVVQVCEGILQESETA